MAMTFGIHVGHMGGPVTELQRLWRFADERGFDWFSVSDHFQESPPQGGELDCFEAITVLTAAAMKTSRVRLGSMVYCVAYRNPGLLAKSLTTIDHLSGGRVDCGLGAGWHEIEARAYGYDFHRMGVRQDMLEEYAQALRLLFDPAQRRATFEGEHYVLRDAPNNPKPVQARIPIWIGGGGEKRTLRATARWADGWNGPYLGPEQWVAKNRVLDEWCEREDRDPATLLRTANLGFYLGTDAASVARQDAILQQQWGPQAVTRTGWVRGLPAQAVELIAQFKEAGAARVNIAFRQGPYDWDALEAFASEVMPALG